MRDILFKAKKLNGSEWAIGSYVHTFNEDKKCPVVGVMTENHWIVKINGNMVLIDKETLCQFTGLTDKNGNKIWENDIIKEYCNGLVGRLIWDVPTATYKLEGFGNDYKIEDARIEWEVIGNIFDNPELINRTEF